MKRQGPNPSLNDFIDARIRLAMASMNCVSIGTIQSFDSVLQQATVSLNYKRIIKDGAMAANNIDTVDVIKEYPLLMKCPVVFLRGGSFRLTFPVAKGDTCLVFFSDRDIDVWAETGVVDAPPNSERMHSFSDAIVLVGISSKANPLADFNTEIASMADLHGERFAQTGDIKDSIRTADHDGWIMMKGDTVGKATGTYQGEKYRDLFNFLKVVSPNAGTEDFDAGATVVIPDVRGRGRVCADNMGGSQAGVLTSANTPNRNVLGGAIGEEKHLLTGRESGIQQHHHTVPGGNTGGGSYTSEGTTALTAVQTSDTGHTDAIDTHNNVPPGSIFNTFIKI